jgi:integrase
VAIIGVHTGLRRRNIVRLKWSEVDLVDRVIKIDSQKTGVPATRKVMHDDVVKVLNEQIETFGISEFVFCKPDGTPFVNFIRHWDQARKKAGIPGFNFRDLRPTYASWRIAEGASLPILQRAMDHTMPGTTGKHYNRVSDPTAELVVNQKSVLDA